MTVGVANLIEAKYRPSSNLQHFLPRRSVAEGSYMLIIQGRRYVVGDDPVDKSGLEIDMQLLKKSTDRRSEWARAPRQVLSLLDQVLSLLDSVATLGSLKIRSIRVGANHTGSSARRQNRHG